MQEDFHYYAAYCAAYLAGYSSDESAVIAYSDQFVDCCTATLLKKLGASVAAATTQSNAELINARTDVLGLQNITRIWSSFHFLPGDLKAELHYGSRTYKNKYRLICQPNGELVEKTVKLAKGQSLESVGIAMHILCDTWAHRNFAGTPAQVINDVPFEMHEILPDGAKRLVKWRLNSGGDDLENGYYTNTINTNSENSIMLLGHGRAGHFPDYSFATYQYMPAWDNYNYIIKNNPEDYMHAFRQMVQALKFLHGDVENFERETYDDVSVDEWVEKIDAILRKRQLIACDDWKTLGKEITGVELSTFDVEKWQQEYSHATGEEKDRTSLGRFAIAAMRQKSMVTKEIHATKNYLAGFSADYNKKGFRGIKDFKKLIEFAKEENNGSI